jgi:hypothetical protein
MPAACTDDLQKITYNSIIRERVRYKDILEEAKIYYVLEMILRNYLNRNIRRDGYYDERWIQEYHYEICSHLEKLKKQIRTIRSSGISIDSVVGCGK